MAIKITGLQELSDSLSKDKFLYKDLHLDYEKQTNIEYPSYKRVERSDIKMSEDVFAIINSIKNLFTTMPGQRFLFPKYGLNPAKWIFQPLSYEVGRAIGRDISEAIADFEPRVQLKLCDIKINEEYQQYEITLKLDFLNLNLTSTLGIILNQETKTWSFLN